MRKRVNPAVIELLEIAKLNTPFSAHLINQSRKKIVDRLLKTNKINQQTAAYLLN